MNLELTGEEKQLSINAAKRLGISSCLVFKDGCWICEPRDTLRELPIGTGNTAEEAIQEVEKLSADLLVLNKVINVAGFNWLIREAVSEDAALDCIAMARVTGSVGGKKIVNDTVFADVVRLHADGHECLPYGEKGVDYSYLLADAVQVEKSPV